MRQAPEGTAAWPNIAVWRLVFVEDGVTSGTRGGRQSYFQLETCGQGLMKSLKSAEQCKLKTVVIEKSVFVYARWRAITI